MEEEEELELQNHLSSPNDLLQYLAHVLTGGFKYFTHRNGAVEVSSNKCKAQRCVYFSYF